MKFKNLAVAALTVTVLGAAVPAASADTAQDLRDNNRGEGFQPGKDGDSFTGSSLTDVASIAVPSFLGVKLIADNTPLKDPINAFAQQVGLGGSSTGISFDLEQLARNAGQPQIADQIAAFKAGSSR